MIKKEKTIIDIIEIAQEHIVSPLPFYLKKIKAKQVMKSHYRYSYSEFYQTKYFICKPFYKVINMPFKNNYSNE
jgi:hypothetical protein